MLEQMDSSEIPVCSSIRLTLFTNATRGLNRTNEPTNERANEWMERNCICWRNPSQSNHTFTLANFSLPAVSWFLIYLSLKIIHGLLHFGQYRYPVCVILMEYCTHRCGQNDWVYKKSYTHTSRIMASLRLRSLTIEMRAWKPQTRTCLSAEIRPRSHVLPDTSTVSLVRFFPLK